MKNNEPSRHLVIEPQDCSNCQHRDPSAGKMQCRFDPEFGCYPSIRFSPDASHIRMQEGRTIGKEMTK